MARGSVADLPVTVTTPGQQIAQDMPIENDVGSVTMPPVVSQGAPSLVEMLLRGRGMIPGTTMPGAGRGMMSPINPATMPGRGGLVGGLGSLGVNTQTPGQILAGTLPPRQPSRLEMALSGQMGRAPITGNIRGPQIMGPPRLPSFYGRPSAPSLGRSIAATPPTMAAGGRAIPAAPSGGQMPPDLLAAIMATRAGGGRGGSVM